jgi:hypothetical protein
MKWLKNISETLSPLRYASGRTNYPADDTVFRHSVFADSNARSTKQMTGQRLIDQ